MKKLGLVIGFMSLMMLAEAPPVDTELIVDLSGTWKFRVGDHITWRNPQYNDEKWDSIGVPGTWESQGYDFDGYAWYRKKFTIPEEYLERRLILIAGKIDDADQTFLNGQLVGSTGSFPPEPQTERNTLRIYDIPENLLEKENLIAIRVFDMGQEGGIHEEPVGIAHEADRDKFLNKHRESRSSN